MSTQFPTGPTRQVQAGDTPDLNDGLLSRGIAASLNLARGNASLLVSGDITLATLALMAAGHAPFVPIESVDNSAGGAGALEASGVEAPQRVALLVEASSTALDPGDFVKPSNNADGTVEAWVPTTDAHFEKYAKYLGKEAALLDRDSSTPFDEILTAGIVPDQTLTPTATAADNVGWFQLMEAGGGAAT